MPAPVLPEARDPFAWYPIVELAWFWSLLPILGLGLLELLPDWLLGIVITLGLLFVLVRGIAAYASRDEVDR